MVETPPPIGVQPDDRLTERERVTKFPRRAVVGRQTVEAGDDDVAQIDASPIVGEDVGNVGLVLWWIVAVRQERLEPERGDRSLDAFDPPSLTLVEQWPGDVRTLHRCLPQPLLRISSPSASSGRPCQRSAPGVAVSLAMSPCIGVPSTSTIAPRSA